MRTRRVKGTAIKWLWIAALICGCSAPPASEITTADGAIQPPAAAAQAHPSPQRCAPPLLQTETVPEWQGSALHEAVMQGDVQAAERLLAEGADANAYDSYRHTPLRAALTPRMSGPVPEPAAVRQRETEQHRQAQRALVELLLAHGADPDLPDERGDTPLLLVTGFGYPDDQTHTLLTQLLGGGADPNRQNAQGATALMEAARRGSSPAVVLLLDHGADRALTDCEGRTALDLAHSHNQADIARLLQADR